jgi:exonuclease SbcD
MKILHTSDLHIGHTFFGFERYEEFEEFFSWLKDLIIKEKIDIVLISGDVFDVYMPSTKALKQYFDFLSSLKGLVKKVIIVGGNHDSPNTLLAPKSILSEIDVTVISGAEDDFCKRIEFDNFDVLAVSYLREGILEKNGGFEEAFSKIYVPSQKPTIAMGHLTVGNFKKANSERDIYIGKIEAIDAEVFDGFSYTALGHIHRPQEVKKGIVYSGSPLQMNFGEDYEKSVVVIDTSDFSYKFVKVPKFRDFVRLSGSFENVKEEIEKIKEGSFVEIELDEIVDGIKLDELRKDNLNIVKIKLPFAEVTGESVDVEKITPRSLVEGIFKKDENLEEILRVFDEIRVESED